MSRAFATCRAGGEHADAPNLEYKHVLLSPQGHLLIKAMSILIGLQGRRGACWRAQFGATPLSKHVCCTTRSRLPFDIVLVVLFLFTCRAGGEHADAPNLEFTAPSKVYTVVGGVTTVLDIMQLPALTPRQISLLAKHGPNGEYAGALLLLKLRQ
jgi:hypothetical protein